MVKRKNFLPTFLATLIFWVSFIFLVIFTAPTSPILLSIFYFLLFIALFLTLSLFLANSRWGFLLSISIVIFLFLRFFKMAHFLNLTLLGGILLSLELYFKKR